MPTKYGINLFISRLSLINFYNYILNVFHEAFKKNKMKNYYQNGMYRFKWSYRITYLINFNFLRRITYFSKQNYLIGSFYLFSKILIYFILQVELIFILCENSSSHKFIFYGRKKKVKYMKLVY